MVTQEWRDNNWFCCCIQQKKYKTTKNNYTRNETIKFHFIFIFFCFKKRKFIKNHKYFLGLAYPFYK